MWLVSLFIYLSEYDDGREREKRSLIAYVNGAMNTPKPERTERNFVAVDRSCHGLWISSIC